MVGLFLLCSYIVSKRLFYAWEAHQDILFAECSPRCLCYCAAPVLVLACGFMFSLRVAEGFHILFWSRDKAKYTTIFIILTGGIIGTITLF